MSVRGNYSPMPQSQWWFNGSLDNPPLILDHKWMITSHILWGCGHLSTYVTSSNGNIFRVAGPLCGEFTGHRWIPLTKTSDAELWCFLWSAPWINGGVNNRDAGDLRRHPAHYDVIVMKLRILTTDCRGGLTISLGHHPFLPFCWL